MSELLENNGAQAQREPVQDPTWGFMLRLRKVTQLYSSAWARSVSTEVTSTQFGVLHLLQLMPGASQKDVGAQLSMDKSNTTDVVARLTKRGYVRVLKDPADQRRNVLMLTADGTTLLEQLRPLVDALRSEAFAEFSSAGRGAFFGAMDTLIDTLERGQTDASTDLTGQAE